ncbi:MAG: electron transport complex subunit E [Tissierellales bacterium]|jgi:electron transport complex protein RnfE|nr:electron transport complex subunit E [Tissierellales bacterium]
MSKKIDILKNGLIKDNPTFVQLLGMCPTLAVTTTAKDGFAMGLATTAVLLGSNLVISLIRKVVPDKIRIPVFIIVIASFVTMIGMMLNAYALPIYNALGLFLPLIVVNCLILGRAESFASKAKPGDAIIDGLGMGLGFTLSLSVLGVIRELLGAGTFLGNAVFGASFQPAIIMILPPGAFLTLGLLIGLVNMISKKKKA